jgi:hypothetical protein
MSLEEKLERIRDLLDNDRVIHAVDALQELMESPDGQGAMEAALVDEKITLVHRIATEISDLTQLVKDSTRWHEYSNHRGVRTRCVPCTVLF